jgi:hypothetical protein
MKLILQNIQTKDSTYNNDVSYRQCLRNMFEMNEQMPHKEIDDITNDENNYDEESMSKSMDIVYEKTKDNVLFQNLYQHGAAKMFSLDQEIGMAVLCSYDYFHLFHMCLKDFFHDFVSFTEESESYKRLLLKVA